MVDINNESSRAIAVGSDNFESIKSIRDIERQIMATYQGELADKGKEICNIIKQHCLFIEHDGDVLFNHLGVVHVVAFLIALHKNQMSIEMPGGIN